jgi:hypothetical protein
MLEKIGLAVVNNDDELTFTLARPLIIYTVIVAKKEGGDVIWHVTPAAMERGNIRWSRTQLTPLAESTYDLIADVQKAADDAPLIEKPIRTITYGRLPPDYKQRTPAPRLNLGISYNVIVIGKEGHATATFAL